MAYCRWSSMDGQCDLYVYASVGDYWSLNVAGRRHKVPHSKWPKRPRKHLVLIEGMTNGYTLTAEGREWEDANWHGEHLYDEITLPHAGETFDLGSPGECADKMLELMALGYLAPMDAVEALRSDQAEMDLAIAIDTRQGGDAQQAPSRSDESAAIAQPLAPNLSSKDLTNGK